jgi:ABC-2 type transport system permease protein
MSWQRIKSLLLHSWYHLHHSPEIWIDLIWFPTIQFFIFGFISRIIITNNPTASTSMLLGFLLWEVVRIGQYCVTISMMWEVWSHSFSTMFVSPLKMKEFMVAQIISGTIKTLFVILCLSALSNVIFHFPIWKLGPMLLVYIASLLIFAFGAGMFISGLIIKFNTGIQSLAWGLIYLFQPFSAVFYPVQALPAVVQPIAYLSPITYVAEAARYQLASGSINWQYVWISFGIGSIYLLLSTLFLNHMFTTAKRSGAFARLGS